jgi:hypothetical protein
MSTLDLETTRTIEQIRSSGIDKQTLERIATDRAEMQRVKEEAKERLPGQFVSLKQDKEQRTFVFTGQYQKAEKPATDFVTKQTIPGRTVTKWRFQVYDVTDPNNPSEVSIWERGNTEAEKVLYWLARQTPQLTIMRNGAPNTYWLLDTLWVILVDGEQSGGIYSTMEQWMRGPGSGPPLHVHGFSDECNKNMKW